MVDEATVNTELQNLKDAITTGAQSIADILSTEKGIWDDFDVTGAVQAIKDFAAGEVDKISKGKANGIITAIDKLIQAGDKKEQADLDFFLDPLTNSCLGKTEGLKGKASGIKNKLKGLFGFAEEESQGWGGGWKNAVSKVTSAVSADSETLKGLLETLKTEAATFLTNMNTKATEAADSTKTLAADLKA